MVPRTTADRDIQRFRFDGKDVGRIRFQLSTMNVHKQRTFAANKANAARPFVAANHLQPVGVHIREFKFKKGIVKAIGSRFPFAE